MKLPDGLRVQAQKVIDNTLLLCGYKQMELGAMGDFAAEV